MSHGNLDRRRFRAIFAAIYAAHLGLCVYVFPASVLFGDLPYGLPDYQTHYQQTSTLIPVLEQYGKLWAYDPHLLAGVPVGLIFDVDNKAHFLFTYGLTRLGVPRPVAFNLFTLLTTLLLPLSLWLAARLLRLGRRAELFVVGLAILLWHFDSTTRHCWAGGMVSFATVSHLSLLVIALYYRMLEAAAGRRAEQAGEPAPATEEAPVSKTGALRYLLALLPLLSLVLLIHVWAFAILVVPLVGLYAKRARQIDRRGHAEVFGLALFALAANLFWLWPALMHFDLVAPSGKVGQATPLFFFWDYFELLVNPVTTGFIEPRTGWRFVALGATVGTLWVWRRERLADGRLFIGLLTICWLYGMTYLAALIPGLRETEPYRFVVPSVLAAALFGGPWLARVLRLDQLRALPSASRGLLLLALVLLIPRAAAGVFQFFPQIHPKPKHPPIRPPEGVRPPNRPVLPLAPTPPTFKPKTFRLVPVLSDQLKLATYLRTLPTDEGRVLIQHWAVGELMRWGTELPIIGGFPDRRLIHEAAFIFRDTPEDPRYWGDELARYLVRYNIRYFVATDRGYEMVEARRDLLEPMKMIEAHRVYRVKHPGSYFQRGTGKVKAAINRIEVSDARPAPGTQLLELKFHYMRSLRCRPVSSGRDAAQVVGGRTDATRGCRLSRLPIPRDPVGFIRVEGTPTLPARFVIEHRY